MSTRKFPGRHVEDLRSEARAVFMRELKQAGLPYEERYADVFKRAVGHLLGGYDNEVQYYSCDALGYAAASMFGYAPGVFPNEGSYADSLRRAAVAVSHCVLAVRLDAPFWDVRVSRVVWSTEDGCFSAPYKKLRIAGMLFLHDLITGENPLPEVLPEDTDDLWVTLCKRYE